MAVKRTEEFRIGYACFKHAVASVIKPKSICEIGVGSGIAARAFLRAVPDVEYFGIDSRLDEKEAEYPIFEHAQKLVKAINSNSDFLVSDSMELDSLWKPYDLVHVDACHEYKYAYHDMELAWKSGSKWILVDDAKDSTVAAAVLEVVRRYHPGSTSMAYFEAAWTGNLLFCLEEAYP